MQLDIELFVNIFLETIKLNHPNCFETCAVIHSSENCCPLKIGLILVETYINNIT